MGMSFSTYIGPFIQIDATVDVENKEMICPNGHDIKHNDTFCSTCGEAIIEEIATSVEDFDLYDFACDNDLNEDVLVRFEYMPDGVYLSNVDVVGVSYDQYESLFMLISDIDIRTELDEFITNDYIAPILKALDDQNIEYKIDCGVISYAS